MRSQTHPLPSTPLHWSSWRMTPPAATEHSDDSLWVQVKCPNCSNNQPPGNPSIFLHPAGRFVCVRCGHCGDLSVLPEHYRAGLAGALAGDNWWLDPKCLGQSLEACAEALKIDVKFLLSLGAGIAPACFNGPDGDEWRDALHLPCRAVKDGPIVDVLAFSFSDDGSLLQSRIPGAMQPPWGWDSVAGTDAIFVNDPRDRLALLASGAPSSCCLPARCHPRQVDGGDWSALQVMEKKVHELTKITLAFTDDEPGHRLEEELARRLNPEICWRVRWKEARFSSDDLEPHTLQNHIQAYEFYASEGAAALLEVLSNAGAFPVAGLHELYDVEDELEVLYEFGLQPGCSTDWPSVDQLYTVVPGQWTLVTGIPSHGKSTWVDALLVNLARRHAWKFGLFSPENQPIVRHYASLMEKYVGAPFSDGPTPRITPQQKDAAKHWLNQHFKVILPDEEAGIWTLDHVLKLAKMLVYRHGIRGLVIDPWNELDNTRPGGMSETEFISLCLTKIRRFARLHRVHVWVIAHPVKMQPKDDGNYPVPTPYDVSGGAHWRNKSDNAICIYRYVSREDEDVTDVHVQKVRFKEVGRPGLVSLRCEVLTGRFFDDIDQEKRSSSLLQGLHLPSASMRTTPRRRYGAELGVPVIIGDPVFT
jgi:twinkle protein